jgi:hypothetical protein
VNQNFANKQQERANENVFEISRRKVLVDHKPNLDQGRHPQGEKQGEIDTPSLFQKQDR